MDPQFSDTPLAWCLVQATQLHIHTHTHTHTHTHAHTHTHTHTRTLHTAHVCTHKKAHHSLSQSHTTCSTILHLPPPSPYHAHLAHVHTHTRAHTTHLTQTYTHLTQTYTHLTQTYRHLAHTCTLTNVCAHACTHPHPHTCTHTLTVQCTMFPSSAMEGSQSSWKGIGSRVAHNEDRDTRIAQLQQCLEAQATQVWGPSVYW